MSQLETAVLGGGCFWCTEAVFEQVIGVEEVVSGYCGGSTPNPTYEDICRGDSGHAEVVRVRFDPAVIDFADILGIFFATHDPTTLNRQGNDRGTQYRSTIFVQNDVQRSVAEACIRNLNAADIWSSPIVTQIEDACPFTAAEAYHQSYYARNPTQGYCAAVVSPKVAKFRKQFASRLKP